MTWQDLVNGAFEAGAGVAVLNHCRALARDWELKGVSVLSTAFFASWGWWNLYYYPHLDQWLSFAGGIAIASANLLWLVMMGLVLRGWDQPQWTGWLGVHVGPALPHDYALSCLDGWHYRDDAPWTRWHRLAARFGWKPRE